MSTLTPLKTLIINYATGYENAMNNRVMSVESDDNAINIRFLINANKALYSSDMVRVFANVSYNVLNGKMSIVTENGEGSRKYNSYVKRECELLTRVFIEEATKLLDVEIKQANREYYDYCHVELLSLINNESSKKNVCFEYINKIQDLYLTGANVSEMSELFETVKADMLHDTRLFTVVSEAPQTSITETKQQRVIFESNYDRVTVTTKYGLYEDVRIHPSDEHDNKHKICYSSDDYFFIDDSDIISITKPYQKAIITKDGVNKSGIGKGLDLIYILETTKDNPILDEINYSNIHTYERNSIQSVLDLFNTYQRLGYHNLNIRTELRYKGNIIIQDATECNIELDVNNEQIERSKRTNKENEQLENELSYYKSFIERYRAKELFEKHVNEKQDEQQKITA